MLFIVATPIGNLDDISKRALQTLESCDAILCEDSRRTGILLERYGIRKSLIPYHMFNEKSLLERIAGDLAEGRKLALVSDAGTPCINDPGQILVQMCVERELPFTVIPGPCSLIEALVLSGFDTKRFQFLGFLPKRPEGVLRGALCFPGTSVAFESPERLVETLKVLTGLDPERNVAAAREMTKTFEECRRGKPGALAAHFQEHAPRGEIVLCIAEGKYPEELTLEELVESLKNMHGLTLKEAIRTAARLLKVPKRDVYKEFHQSV